MLVRIFIFVICWGIASSLSQPIHAAWTLSFQPQAKYFNYFEKLTLPKKSQEYGVLPGIGFAINTREIAIAESWQLSLDAHSGPVIYDGSTQDGRPLKSVKINSHYRVESSLGFFSTLDIGIGHNIWQRQLFSFDETYQRTYIKATVRFPVQFNRSTATRFQVTATIPVYSQMVLYFKTVDNIDPINFRLGDEIGWKFSAPTITRIFGVQTVITPSVEWFAFGKSSTHVLTQESGRRLGIWEPASETLTIGLSATIKF